MTLNNATYKTKDIYDFLSGEDGFGEKAANHFYEKFGVKGRVTARKVRNWFFSCPYLFRLPSLIEQNIREMECHCACHIEIK